MGKHFTEQIMEQIMEISVQMQNYYNDLDTLCRVIHLMMSFDERKREREKKNQSNRISSTLSLYYRTDKRCQMAFGSLKVRLYVTRLFWAKPADRPTDRPINRQHIFFCSHHHHRLSMTTTTSSSFYVNKKKSLPSDSIKFFVCIHFYYVYFCLTTTMTISYFTWE